MAIALGPDLEVQGAIVAILGASADVKQLLGNPPRINPAQSTTWPGSYIQIGEGQNVPDLAECVDGSEVYADIHIWSRADSSFVDAKKIAATIWKALKAATPTLTENRLLPVEGESQFFLRSGQHEERDPDGTTLHIIFTVKSLTEPAA